MRWPSGARVETPLTHNDTRGAVLGLNQHWYPRGLTINNTSYKKRPATALCVADCALKSIYHDSSALAPSHKHVQIDCSQTGVFCSRCHRAKGKPWVYFASMPTEVTSVRTHELRCLALIFSIWTSLLSRGITDDLQSRTVWQWSHKSSYVTLWFGLFPTVNRCYSELSLYTFSCCILFSHSLFVELVLAEGWFKTTVTSRTV